MVAEPKIMEKKSVKNENTEFKFMNNALESGRITHVKITQPLFLILNEKKGENRKEMGKAFYKETSNTKLKQIEKRSKIEKSFVSVLVSWPTQP